MSILRYVAGEPLLRRNQLYFLLLLLGLVNTAFQSGMAFYLQYGPAAAFMELFGISAVAWVSLAAAGALLAQSDDDSLADPVDLVFAAATIFACLLPFRSAAAVATTLVALRAMLVAPPGTALFRTGAISLSIAGALFWGRLLLNASGTALLELDVALAGTLSGLKTDGNMLFYATSDPEFVGKGFIVAQACSSLHGLSIALLAWVLVTQFYGLPANRRTIGFGLLGVLGTIAVNVARLSAMSYFPRHFDWLHDGAGASIAGAIAMIVVMGANLGGNWNAVTSNG